MKRMKMISLVLALSVIFGFYGVAFSGGGPEDPACPTPLPDPNTGQFLQGEFTVAQDKGLCSVDPISAEYCRHYNVHLLLRWSNQEHLFSLMTAMGTGYLCSYTSEELKEIFARVPCGMAVGAAFGLSGVPVIASLEIVQQDSCDTNDEMIRGVIIIRVTK